MDQQQMFEIGQMVLRLAPFIYGFAVLAIIIVVHNFINIRSKSPLDIVFSLVGLGVSVYLVILANTF